jgi:hypothetical protein
LVFIETHRNTVDIHEGSAPCVGAEPTALSLRCAISTTSSGVGVSNLNACTPANPGGGVLLAVCLPATGDAVVLRGTAGEIGYACSGRHGSVTKASRSVGAGPSGGWIGVSRRVSRATNLSANRMYERTLKSDAFEQCCFIA